jgi:hypothetical protein
MINALDSLSPNQRADVLSYTPIADGIGKQLQEAADKAIQRGDYIYLEVCGDTCLNVRSR